MSLPYSWCGSCFVRPPHGTISRAEPPWRKHARLPIANHGTLPVVTAGFRRGHHHAGSQGHIRQACYASRFRQSAICSMVRRTANPATLAETAARLAAIVRRACETWPWSASHVRARLRVRSTQPTLRGFAYASHDCGRSQQATSTRNVRGPVGRTRSNRDALAPQIARGRAIHPGIGASGLPQSR